jgi:protein-tyrosine phosphatase
VWTTITRSIAGTDDPLKASFAMSYVDLHCHLLPGLDDGAATLDDALTHARRLDAEGVRDVACTPHVKARVFPAVPLDELPERIATLQAAIDAAALRVRLHGGGEVAHPDALRLSPEALELVAQGPADARWILLECPFAGLDAAFTAAAHRLTALGYGLVLAHPERAADVLGSGHQRLEALRAEGALLQVNVCSLLGNHGLRIQEIASALVRSGTAFCLASDGHPGSREHTLQLGLDLLLRAGVSSSQAYRLTQGNPRFLLESGTPALRVDEMARAALV